MRLESHREIRAALLQCGVLLVFQSEAILSQEQRGSFQLGAQIFCSARIARVLELGANFAVIADGKRPEPARFTDAGLNGGIEGGSLVVETVVAQVVTSAHN